MTFRAVPAADARRKQNEKEVARRDPKTRTSGERLDVGVRDPSAARRWPCRSREQNTGERAKETTTQVTVRAGKADNPNFPFARQFSEALALATTALSRSTSRKARAPSRMSSMRRRDGPNTIFTASRSVVLQRRHGAQAFHAQSAAMTIFARCSRCRRKPCIGSCVRTAASQSLADLAGHSFHSWQTKAASASASRQRAAGARHREKGSADRYRCRGGARGGDEQQGQRPRHGRQFPNSHGRRYRQSDADSSFGFAAAADREDGGGR